MRWFAISCAWAVLFIVFGLVFAYAAVAVPFADDYSRATTATFAEAYQRVVSDYFKWTGRWASMAMQYGAWAFIGGDIKSFLLGYRISLIIVLLVNLLGWYFLVRLITGLNHWKALILGIACGGTYFSVIHSPGQTLYWLPGATEGGLSSLIAALVLWGALPLFLQKWARISALKIFLLSMGIFVSAGCHELGGMFLASFFGLALAYGLLLQCNWNKKILLYLLIASFVASAIAVFAPGNTVRAEWEGMQSGSLLESINAGSQICLRTLRTILSPSILLGSAILFLYAKSQPDFVFKVNKSESFFLVIAVPLVLALVAAVVAWKTAAIPAGRTINFFVSLLVYIWLPSLVIFASRLSHLNINSISSQVSVCIWLVFALSILIGPMVDRAFFSYKTHLPDWIQYQSHKHRILMMADSFDTVHLNEPPPPPPMFFTETDITADSKAWINRVQAAFYGVSAIVLDKNLDLE